MKTISILLLSVFVVLSCSRTYEKTSPKDLIPADIMEDILVDMYVLEASVRNCITANKKDSLPQWIAQEMNVILRKRNIHYDQFESSYSYYMGNEKKSQKIMENVVNRLIEKETESSLKSQHAQKKDSITLEITATDVVNKIVPLKK
ncbi:MAG: DUF4296 domain-containing protein [Bacteroidales bacterium]|jgi:hypothetical protein|nr:DUF4296 domain-containing protein [Bacteroidales bacterium]